MTNGTTAAFMFEDLAVGQRSEFETPVTGADVDKFAALSGDMSPLHFSSDFAKRCGSSRIFNWLAIIWPMRCLGKWR